LNRKSQIRKIRYVFVKRKIKNLRILLKFLVCKKFGIANHISANLEKYWVRKSQIRKLPHLRKICKLYKFCKSENLWICYLRNLFVDHSPLQICHRYQPHQRYRRENLRCCWFRWYTLTCE
jgi:hypothetical protein